MQSLSPEPLLSEEDYGAIEAAVMETARGRWFLAEYARRNRNADTEAVLTAIRRLERLVQSSVALDARDEVTRGMADIAQAIAAAQSAPATVDAASKAASASAQPLPTTLEHHAEKRAPIFGENDATIMTDGNVSEPQIGSDAVDLSPRTIAEPVQGEPGIGASKPVLTVEETAPAAVAFSSTEPGSIEADERLEHHSEMSTPIFGKNDASTIDDGIEADSEVGSDAAEPEVAGIDRGWERLELAATEIAALGLPPELASQDSTDVSFAQVTDEQVEPEVPTAATMQSEVVFASGVGEAEPGELFPILELDEEATEALLTLDVPRQELILPANHLATQRWHKELAAGEETARHRLDKWAAISGKSEIAAGFSTGEGDQDKVLDMVAVVEEALEPAPPSGLVTFIDEEPVEEEQSIFTAPLRLEPEATIDHEVMVVAHKPAAAAQPRELAPRVTLGEIEAMPFIKKAALFS
ncbi:hypothetical protein AB4037_29775 [Labrys sp. KB_33_2]|uniref:hypothetical protein n=1 Tax=Labrys sp. KB_33_2 TaxID=3237479 RepID=UPI003F924B5C